MKIKNLFASIILSTLLPVSASAADAQINIDYNEQTDLLSLNIKDAYLDDVLNKLSTRVGFMLSYDEDIHREISLDISDTSKKVLQTLVKPNNVILSQANTSPHKVTKVILLPVGTETSTYLPKESLSPPVPTGDANKDEKHMKRYLKKIKQLEQGPDKPRRGKMISPGELNATNETSDTTKP